MTKMKRIYEDGGDQNKNEDDGKECKELNKAEQWREEDEIICATCCKWKPELQVDHEEKAHPVMQLCDQSHCDCVKRTDCVSFAKKTGSGFTLMA